MTKKWNRKKTAILIAGIAVLVLIICLVLTLKNHDGKTNLQADDSVETKQPAELQTGETEVSLTEHEQEIIQTMSNEIHDITDDTYAEIVPDMIANPGKYSGQLYRLEGVYKKDTDWPCITRTIVTGEEKESCSLPMKYFKKDIRDGAWIRITGVISEANEKDGSKFTTIEVLTIEAFETPGQKEVSASKS